MNIVFGIIIGLFVLMSLVVLHEFGHFIMARKNGVKVNEFGIGFPPRAIAWVRQSVEVTDKKTGEKVTKQKWVKIPRNKWKDQQERLIFSINWLPIGGFCAMDGESDADTRKGTFGAASFWSKTKILFGGVLMNWLTAFVILLVLAFIGMPQFINNQFYIGSDADIKAGGVIVYSIVEGSPAEKAGFKQGDIIVDLCEQKNGCSFEVNNNKVTISPLAPQGHGPSEQTRILTPETVINYGKTQSESDGQFAGYGGYFIIRDGKRKNIVAKLNPPESEYSLGIQMDYGQTTIRSTWSAPIVAAATTAQLTGETFKSLGEMLWNLASGVVRMFSPNSEQREEGMAAIGSAGDSVTGPVGIIGIIFPAFASSGLNNVLFLAALISVSLACMNVLPIPALDGGRWLLIAIFRLRKKKLTKETEEKIVSRAFIVLIGLIILITILDIIKLF